MDNSSMPNLLLKSESSEVLDPLWVPNSSPSFHGSASMEDENTSDKTLIFTEIDNKLDNCNEEFHVCFHQPKKKRRLSHDQVHYLEKSFEIDNKLEPERKFQLAKELVLQPRQVAIWFQNRRARYKTKVLEREYSSLKASYDKLKVDYDTLLKENEKMKNEVNLLTEKVLMNCKQEEAKSDVLDSENHSQNEEGSFPKMEMEGCDDLQPNSCNLGFPVQDQGTWLWQY